jgi:hypothetical protein
MKRYTLWEKSANLHRREIMARLVEACKYLQDQMKFTISSFREVLRPAPTTAGERRLVIRYTNLSLPKVLGIPAE